MKGKSLLKLVSAICLAALVAIPLAVSCAAPEPVPGPPGPAGPAGVPGSPAPAPAPAEVFKLRIQSSESTSHVTYQLFKEQLDVVRFLSEGRLDITLYPSDSLVPNFELFEAIGKGTVDMYQSYAAYWGGIDPGFPPFCHYPMGMNGEDYMTWFYQYGGLELMRKAYAPHNIYVSDIWGHGVEPINSTIPLRTVEDMKGTKGRMGGLFGEVCKEMGASLMMVSPAEAYTNLQTGIIDWADTSNIISNWEMGLQEVCPYLIFPGWQQETSQATIGINMDKWNELPDDLKALLHMSMRALAEEIRELVDWKCAETMNKHQEYGTEIIVWSDEELAKSEKIIKRLEDEVWMKRSPLLAEVIQSQRDFWEVFGPYKYSVLTKKAS